MGTGTGSAATALVRSATALAALGAIDTLAGATVVVASPASPLAATTGTAISGAAFGLNGTTIQAESWVLKSTLPPGVTLNGLDSNRNPTATLTGPGTVPGAYVVLEGTPTTSGTYYLDLVAYEYPGATGAYTPDFLYTVNVTGSTIVPVTITSQPVSQTVVTGSTAVFSAAATSTASLSYQWSLNGAPIANATSTRLVINDAPVGSNSVTMTASNSSGGTATASATLTVVAASSSSGQNPGRLINESVLTAVPTGGQLSVGFFSSAAGQRLLIRGIGPGLSSFLSNVVTDPSIQVFPSGSNTPSATNDNWSTNPNAAAAINAADSATGAFALTAGSLDAALVLTPTVAGSSVVYTPNTTGGSGLAEIYDYPTGTYVPGTTPRIVNLSTLFQVGAGATLSAGFVVGGATSKTFLIRAMGPTLAKAPFGLMGTMSDPQLTLVTSSDAVIATDTNWGGNAQLSAAATQVQAFAFATNPALADSALLVTLAPGNYTAEATSASGASGTVLIEVYEVP